MVKLRDYKEHLLKQLQDFVGAAIFLKQDLLRSIHDCEISNVTRSKYLKKHHHMRISLRFQKNNSIPLSKKDFIEYQRC